MRNWRKSVLEVGLIGLLALSSGQASALDDARSDSLVSYVELLERDLIQCEIISIALEDSLQVHLRVMGWELEAANSLKMRWYEKPYLWFLFGAAASVLVIGSTVRLTF